ncbi:MULTISPECIES: winged helix-turn-helix domain-containing protein [Sulfurimonas]|uniref:winged helix-turn-helix domain-containing protein n=1 Tax=Sulfurimonas TaxID=202746 RepID=UPI001E5D7CAF|nr:winged helix-turn-helix domain-containing protein [Sulfurimonas hydrogeniphila]
MSKNVVLVFEANDTDIVDIENYIASRGYEIKKIDKKTKKADKNIIEFATGYHFNLKTKETFYQNQKLKLTKKESLFLKLLLLNMGQVVTFEQATNYIWNKEELITENNLRTLVWRLRNKLKTDIIKNNQGIGYFIEA